jgi:uncharacterized protein with ParB-like and HNH nuclease domain
MRHKDIKALTVSDLFISGEYVIPPYQRNYAWEEGEVKQLLQDVFDFSNAYPEKDYFIGTLVVFNRNENGRTVYETIDGQQRLTTLNIIYGVLHREFSNEIHSKIEYRLNLKFDSRKKSTDTLALISQTEYPASFDSGEDFNAKIVDAYEVAHKQLKLFFKNKSLEQFYKYFSQKVHILRVSVPHDTNLNHYFEIMNTRGEQLEKHEILKAKLMEVLSGDEKASYAFHLIWEACADMERYVQYGLNTTERDKIFTSGNWNKLTVNSFDDLANYIGHKEVAGQERKMKVSEVVEHNGNFEINTDHKEDAPERFNSIINFQNFLLHILRIQTKENISLDDKRLVEAFDEILKSKTSDKEKLIFVKDFAYCLLKGKHLFDQFIVKREFTKEKDGWSLKSLKWYEGNKVSYVNSFGNEEANKRILMLLSMFHVSSPTLIYKHWLSAVLHYCFENYGNMDAIGYINHLENLAQAYLYDRYLAFEGSEVDFYDIIFKNHSASKNKLNASTYSWTALNKGTDVENFVFNYLDYILWLERSDGFTEFEFTFRSSVEHYYPQNPISNHDKLEQEVLDEFGNLCLISRSKNSTLGRYMPEAKKDHYVRVKPDSLKQRLMMNEPRWEEGQIRLHTKMMIDKLRKYKIQLDDAQQN